MKKLIELDKSLLNVEAQTFADGSQSEAKTLKSYDVLCKNPFYPYDEDGDFLIKLKGGKNEVEFATQDHYNSFIVAITSEIMDGTILVGEVDGEGDEK